MKAWANGAIRNFFLVDLVAVVAIAAVHSFFVVSESQAATVLSNFFAFFPVADEFAIGGPLDGLHVDLFDALGGLFVQGLARSISFTASLIGFVGVQDAGLHNALIAERSLDNLLGEGVQVCY